MTKFKDSMRAQRILGATIYHVLVMGLGIVMVYPLIWMIMSSFKETEMIFISAADLIPDVFVFENYSNGWAGFAKTSFATFFANSMYISTVATVGTVFSSSIVAFGLSRCNFIGKRFLFVCMLLSMMLPAQILMIPQYLWYNKLGWVGSNMPLIAPYFFAIQGFFIYLIYNFIEGIPRDLDEAAKIDGCSYYTTYLNVILPLTIPSMITAAIFSFMWRWDDFLSALLYVKDTSKYTASLALKLFCDPSSSSDFGAMFAMATLSILPIITIFIFCQRFLVDGIATTGLKG